MHDSRQPRFARLAPSARAASLLFALTAAAGAQSTPPDLDALFTAGADRGESQQGLRFREVGPYRGGRSCAVAGVPGARETFWMGSTGGGVWRTDDGGRTWRNRSDGTFGGSIGAIAVAPSDPNVVWVGTGEKTVRGNVSHGDGVWRTVDGGETWAHVGLADSRHICRLRVHPTDPETAYVAALGHLFGPNPQRGVYRTTDGGATWQRVLFVDEEVGAVDLCLDPKNPRTLYATTWRVLRTPWSLESGGAGSGLWKSVDGGDTWTELTGNPGLPKGVLGIGAITVSPSNPRNLYAILEAEDGGVFRSRDAGATWSKVNDERKLRQRAWYYTRIQADPVDAEAVYVLNVGLHRSIDGGRTFEGVRTPHSDNHDLWIDPVDPTRMIESNDGGANVSFDGGATWSSQDNQPTAQMYRVSVDTSEPYRLLGGQQDNSALRIKSRAYGAGGIGEREFEATAGGESGHVVAHPDDPDLVFGGSYGGYLTLENHRTGESRTVTVWPDNPMGYGAEGMRYRFQWSFPIFFSPHAGEAGAGRALYAGSNVLFRSTDLGASWEAISPDLTRNDKAKLGPSGGPITKDNTGVEYYCTIFTGFESPRERGVIWVGSDDGRVHVTRDAGVSWTDVTPAELPEWTQVNDLVFDPHRPGGAYLAGTRYKLDDFTPYLFHTEDYGVHWRRIDAGIPRDHFTRAVLADPVRAGLLAAGTERGLYVSLDNGASWAPFQAGLPLVPITDLEVYRGDWIAATQGRGYWILDRPEALRQFDDAAQRGRSVLYRPAPATRARLSSWGGAQGKNPPFGAVLELRLGASIGDETPFQLEILEPDGDVVRTFTPKGRGARREHAAEDDRVLPTEPGFHRFVWDLRYPGAEDFDGMILWSGSMRGALAPPGEYRVRFTVDGNSVEQPLTLQQDPRSSVGEADTRAQFEFVSELGALLTRAHRAIRDVRDARADLALVEGRLALARAAGADAARCDALTRDIDAARVALDEVEQALYQTRNKSGQDPLNYPIQLTDKLAGVRSAAQDGDFAPTAQQRAVAAELSARIEAQLVRLDAAFASLLPAIDAEARALEVPLIRGRSAGQAPGDAGALSAASR
ncbi:MAG: glycosyl hydrolase [Planctomycetota bacterium]